MDRIASFDAFHFVGLVSPRPLLMIVGQEAATAWMSREAVGMAREPKELHWIEGATHVSLYDVEQYVAPAVAELSGFFRTHLGRRVATAR